MGSFNGGGFDFSLIIGEIFSLIIDLGSSSGFGSGGQDQV